MSRLLTLIILFHSGILSAQRTSYEDASQIKNLKDITEMLDKHVQDLAQEKIHVQFDKAHYQPGDTVWYKLYLINSFSNKLSALSKIVHVEVVHSNHLLQKQILPVEAGMTAGYLVLSSSLFKQGNYQFNVFTRLMRNGKKQFYTFKLEVETDSGSGTHVTSKQPTVLHFYPESGTLVAGLRSKVVVQSIDDEGNGVAVNGYVLDEEDKKVAEFNTGQSGMGMFALSPKNNVEYKAVLDSHLTDKRFMLPKVTDSGYVLAVNSLAKDTLTVKISASFKNKDELKVLIQAKGNIINEVPIKLQSGLAVLKVPKSILPGGLNEFALFSAGNNLLATRLLFLPQNKSLNKLLTLSDHEYGTREQVKMSLNVRDASGSGVVGGYSISVARVSEEIDGNQHQQTIWSSEIFWFGYNRK
jgi:hypothetical protein